MFFPTTRTSHTEQSQKPIRPSREPKDEGREVWGSIKEWWGLWPAGSRVSCLSEGSCCFSAPPDSLPEENKLSVASSSDSFKLKKKEILKISLPFKKMLEMNSYFFGKHHKARMVWPWTKHICGLPGCIFRTWEEHKSCKWTVFASQLPTACLASCPYVTCPFYVLGSLEKEVDCDGFVTECCDDDQWYMSSTFSLLLF